MAINPTVFVTSATGSQGTALCLQLRQLGWHVRATTRDLGSPAAQSLRVAGVHLTGGGWDDEEALRKGIEGCDKLFLCLLLDLTDFDRAPRRAELITRLAREAGVRQDIASTTLGCFLIEEGYKPPVQLGPFFDAHVHSKKRVEQAVINGGFEHWTILRPSFFMANFVEPKIQFGYTEIKEGTWKSSLTADTALGLVDQVDIARFAVAAFQSPEAIGDGRFIEAVFMTDREVAEEQAKGSWLFFASEPCLRYLSNYIDMDQLKDIVPRLTTFKEFLEREKDAVKKTYLS